MTRLRTIILFLLGVAVVAPAVAWASFKPVRIFAAELNGVFCKGRTCVEDPALLDRAEQLQLAAVAEVGAVGHHG